MNRVVRWLLLATLLVGCASPKRNELRLEAVAPSPTPAKAGPAARRICWLPLIDQRPDKELIGQIGRETYAADHIDRWLMQALQKISPASRTAETYAPEPNTLGIRARLLRLYIQNVDLTKSAHVVIELEYLRAEAEPVRKLYRGRYTGINWWGTDEEINRAFCSALQDCVDKIAVDLPR